MSRKILVIDDDPVGTRLIEYTLKQRGYQVVTAQNGVAGLRKAVAEGPDLIVLNVMLPGMDGFEVCHRLRMEDRTAQLPVLILSGRAQPADRATGFKMGADDYLTKPATPSEIISRVESLLSRKAADKAEVIVFLGSRRRVGTTTTVANTAVALAKMGKRVIAVDLCPYEGSISQRLGVRSRDDTRLLERPLDAVKRDDLESALAVHETGVRVLGIPGASGQSGNIAPENIDLLFDRLGEVTDYFLADLPFQPTVAIRAVLTRCGRAIIVSDGALDAITGVKSIITTLHFLGIPPERLGIVVTDSNGTLPGLELAQMKPYLETSLGISLLGTLPRSVDDARPDAPLAGAINELAKQIISREPRAGRDARTVVREP